MAYNRKIEQTQRLLKEALIKLLGQQNFEEITVNDIVSEAYVTRSTFYRYYDDKYELLSEIEDQILQFIRNEREVEFLMDDKTEIFDTDNIIKLFNALDRYSEVLRVLLTNVGVLSFKMKIRKIVSQRLDFLNKMFQSSNVRLELGKEYLIAIIIQTFEYWAQYKDKVSEEEIAQMITAVYHQGLINALNINVKELKSAQIKIKRVKIRAML